MYVPDHFREDRPEVLRDAMRRIAFATLVTTDAAGGLDANHLPMLLEGDVLKGHVARANPVWKSALPALKGMHGSGSFTTRMKLLLLPRHVPMDTLDLS